MKKNKFFIILTLIFCGSLFNISGFSQNQNYSWSVKSENSNAFIENKGQFPVVPNDKISKDDVLFAVDNGSAKIYFTKKGVTYYFIQPNEKNEGNDAEKASGTLEKWMEREEKAKHKEFKLDEISFIWENSNPDVAVIAEDPNSEYFSYSFKENNEVKNINFIKGYKKITYKNLYANIDVEYTFHPTDGIKYALILHPGADVSTIKMKYSDASALSENGDVHISTLFGDIIDHAPESFYTENSSLPIKSYFIKTENTIGFALDSYDNSKSVTIDPWVVYPSFSNSTAAWEVETDAFGNVYVTGGEMPMQLQKYNSSGVLQWTYSTPWDTATMWLGTLATDSSGNSYITSGSVPEMEKIDNNANMIWHNNGLNTNCEYWAITFNCDKTKLIVGGTTLNLTPIEAYATIFEMDIDNGNVLALQNFAYTDLSVMFNTPVEVRSIATSKNAEYIFLTHNDVGAINPNIGDCPAGDTVFQVDNGHHLSYKCENYLPATQNGGGLKALVAGDQFFYTHSGDQIHKRSLSDGSLILSVTIPGGVNDTDYFGEFVVENCGLAIDNCGNVYAGSSDRVVKLDADLNILDQATVPFYVYDVSVNSNGEVIAVGAQFNNQSVNRNGRIQSVNLSACTQYELVCCEANICSVNPVCSYDAPFNLTSSSSGGTWSGTGITNSTAGTFDPTVSGSGTFTVVYTIPCGSDSINITVNACAILTICQEANGDLTVTGGTGPYIWEEYISGSSTPITNQTECVACGYSWQIFQCMDGSMNPVTQCPGTGTWSNFAIGTTVTPPVGADTIRVNDASVNSQIAYNISSLPICTNCPTINITPSNIVHVLCYGASTGSFTASGSGGTSPYNYTLLNGSTVIATYSNVSGSQNFTGLPAGTYILNIVDDSACAGSAIINISQPVSPVLAAITGITPPTCGQSDGSATASGSGGTLPYTYSWNSSPVQNTQTAVNLPAGYYCVTVTDGNNCSAATCDSVGGALFTAPDICMVSVDTALNQNIVIWEKPVTSGIDQYYIFRESSISGIYNLIGTQNYSDLSTFVDMTSNSLQQQYRYKLAIYDYCGLLSQQSTYHQTIHLTINAGMGGSWNLLWNNYEGYTFSTYNIYRGTNAGNLTLLNSVASSVNSYSDMTPPYGILYYLIEAVRPTPCNPSFKKADNYSSTISNVACTNLSGIPVINSNEGILIYPNPGEGIITILFSELANKSTSVEILNSLGQLVYADIMNTNTKNIDVSKLSKGIYSLKLTIAGKSYFEKVVIE
ncbi:MAG: T9SS type A sorting domain-containing protein [Bacteroidota bacterium]